MDWDEQTVQVANDIHANKILPIHWGKFDLANHPWQEPIERLIEAVKPYDFQIATPEIGEIFNINQSLPNELWWQTIK